MKLASIRVRGTSILAVAVLGAICGAAQTAPLADAARQTALNLEQQGNIPEAETAWHEVLKVKPGSAEAYAHLGLLEAHQQHYKQAAPLYRKALALDPAMPGVRLDLGLALFKDEQLKPAIHEFELLLAKTPAGSPDAQRLTILLGMAHYGAQDYVPAAKYLKQAAASDPQNLQLRLTLAHSCLWSKQYQCVLDVYHEMLTLNSESPEVDMLAGEAEDAMKNYDGAIAQFRAAIAANPAEPNAHFGLGYIHWTQRRYADAATQFQAEIANNPNHAQALAYLGDAEMQLNHPELAVEPLTTAVRIAPGMELAHLDLGILASDAGRNDEAERELSTAAKLAPEDVNAHWRLGQLYRKMGKRDLAKAELDKANSLHRATDKALVDQMSGDHARQP